MRRKWKKIPYKDKTNSRPSENKVHVLKVKQNDTARSNTEHETHRTQEKKMTYIQKHAQKVKQTRKTQENTNREHRGKTREDVMKS